MAAPTTYVLSDLHLAPAAPEDGPWRRYLTPRYFPDHRVAALFDSIAAAGAPAEVVLAGDTFDFDLVSGAEAEPAGNPLSRWSGAERSAAAAARRLDAALDAHPVFERALARLLGAGVPVIVLAGNHDAELAWPEVQEELAARLERAGGGARAGLRFEHWFHFRPGLLYVEHGHQHDPHTRPVDVRAGLAAGGARARLPFASICQRALANHLGAFNTTVEASYILGAREYVVHWWRYYAFSGRSLFLAWLFGAQIAFANIVRQEWREPGPPPPREIDAYAAARGLATGAGAALAALWPEPAIRDPVAVVRELWLDRALACVAAVLLGAALAGLGMSALVAFAVPAVLLVLTLVGLSLAMGASAVAAYARRLPAAAERIAAEASVPFVVLGHTHGPMLARFGRGAYVNSGAWSPGFLDSECTRPAHERFTFVEVDASLREVRLCRQEEDGRVILARAAAGEIPAAR